MDMDDDFMGEIEFDLSAEQGRIVSRAISLASTMDDDAFRAVLPREDRGPSADRARPDDDEVGAVSVRHRALPLEEAEV